jgi:hypothetical protein
VSTLDKPSRHESPELGAAIGRMMNALIRRAAEGDTEAVEALGSLESLARQANTSGLCEARRAGGYSLADLAKVTGTSRQAVSQRTASAPTFGTTPLDCAHHGCVGMARCRVGASDRGIPPTRPQTVHTHTQDEALT